MKMSAIEKHFVNKPSHTRVVADRALQLLNRVSPQPGWRYLDVGCGVGSAAMEIAGTSGLRVTGIDVDPKQIEEAKRKGTLQNLQFRVMDATALQFADGEFDVVATSMVTHHIPNWERAFSEMVRVLRNGGYLIYSDHVFPSWLAKAARRLMRFTPSPVRALIGFPSASALEPLTIQAGLRKVYGDGSSRHVTTIWVKNA
jgi:ubiquinone/menaquinone biosynthesis C-methylase UbiE